MIEVLRFDENRSTVRIVATSERWIVATQLLPPELGSERLQLDVLDSLCHAILCIITTVDEESILLTRFSVVLELIPYLFCLNP